MTANNHHFQIASIQNMTNSNLRQKEKKLLLNYMVGNKKKTFSNVLIIREKRGPYHQMKTFHQKCRPLKKSAPLHSLQKIYTSNIPVIEDVHRKVRVDRMQYIQCQTYKGRRCIGQRWCLERGQFTFVNLNGFKFVIPLRKPESGLRVRAQVEPIIHTCGMFRLTKCFALFSQSGGKARIF